MANTFTNVLKIIKRLQKSPKYSAAFIILVMIVSFASYSLGYDAIQNSEGAVQGLSQEEGIAGPYRVDRVVDGDTLKVMIDGRIETIRLIGIDTPETVDPRKGVECFGQEASDQLEKLIGNKVVYLEADDSQDDSDRYGRLLRYLYVEGEEEGVLVNVNEVLVVEGFAHEYTYEKPYKYQIEFQEAEMYARVNDNGLWGANCEAE